MLLQQSKILNFPVFLIATFETMKFTEITISSLTNYTSIYEAEPVRLIITFSLTTWHQHHKLIPSLKIVIYFENYANKVYYHNGQPMSHHITALHLCIPTNKTSTTRKHIAPMQTFDRCYIMLIVNWWPSTMKTNVNPTSACAHLHRTIIYQRNLIIHHYFIYITLYLYTLQCYCAIHFLFVR